MRKVVLIATLATAVVAGLPPLLDEAQWRHASSGDTARRYGAYLAQWPSGRHAGEARARYAERGWAEAVTAGTVQAIREYRQAHAGIHTAEARALEEDLAWRDALQGGTIRALRSYVDAFPEGRFVADARARQEASHRDDTVFAEAVRHGTEAAIRRFLEDFPDHARTAEAHTVLREITAGRDLVDLIDERKVEAEATGAGIESVALRVRRLVPYSVAVLIPAGTYFVSHNASAQNMVTTEGLRVALEADEWQTLSVSAACANRPRDIPENDDAFSVQRSPRQAELRKLMPVLARAGAPYAVRQAAVWIVTDDASYSDLGTLVTGFGGFGSRAIDQEAAATAIKICQDAGIDMARKAIWRDRQEIAGALKDSALKQWLSAAR